MSSNDNTEPDLDLSNYDLQDILNLFQISENFNEADLKKAKRQVLKLHPDKSRIDSKYFLFYSKAYKVLYSIFEFNNKSDKKEEGEEDYVPLDINEEDRKIALDKFFESNEKLQKSKNFNDWFNKEFDKQKQQQNPDEEGYGSWLTSNEDIDQSEQINSVSAMADKFARKKKEVRSLVKKQDVTDLQMGQSFGGSELGSGLMDNYSSDMFSSVQFQDLKQAHVESVVPVTEDDLLSKQVFGNVNEIISHRQKQDTTPMSERQALQYLANREKDDNVLSTNRAFELAKQTESAKEKSQEFWAGIMKLKN